MCRSIPVIAVAIFMATCVIAFTSIVGSAGAVGAAVRWEYRVVEGSPSFNDLGNDGWELVAVYPGVKSGIYAYFKRLRR
jgi:hypothetical protein